MFVNDFKRLFMKGLAALLPTVVTIALLLWAFNWVNGHIASPITDWIITFLPDPEEVPGFFRGTWLKTDATRDSLQYGQQLDRLDPETGRPLTLEYEIVHHPMCYLSDQDIEFVIENGIRARRPAEEQDRLTQLRKEARKRRAVAMWHIAFSKWRLNVIGFLIAIVIVYVVGYFLSGLLGRTVLRIVESTVLRIPFIRSLYPNIKQVTDFLFGDRQIEFGGVVAVEYPRRGVWSLGLLTGPAMKTIEKRASADDLVTVFIPSSPTPVTGYTITVPRSDVIELGLSIDEALRFTISGGVIKPPSEGGQPEMARKDVFKG